MSEGTRALPPPPHKGYTRQWVRCKTCGRVAYYDYIPYSLGNPITWLPCGHGIGQSWIEIQDGITEVEAYRALGLLTRTPEEALEEIAHRYDDLLEYAYQSDNGVLQIGFRDVKVAACATDSYAFVRAIPAALAQEYPQYRFRVALVFADPQEVG